VHVHPRGRALRLVFPAAVGELAGLLLLLGVHRHDRVPGGQELAGPVADVTELGVPVSVLGALGHHRVALQAVALLAQQPRHRPVRHRMPGRRQGARQVPRRLGGPAQRRLRIPAGLRVHQRRQCRDQPRVGVSQLLAAAAGRPHPRLRPAFRLPHPPAYRVRVHASRRRHSLDAAAAQLQRLRPEQQPPLTLIQVRAQQPVQPCHPLAGGLPAPVAVRHTTDGRPSGAKNLAYFVARAKHRTHPLLPRIVRAPGARLRALPPGRSAW